MRHIHKHLLPLATALALAAAASAASAAEGAATGTAESSARTEHGLDTQRNYEREHAITSREALPSLPAFDDWRKREAWRQRFSGQ